MTSLSTSNPGPFCEVTEPTKRTDEPMIPTEGAASGPAWGQYSDGPVIGLDYRTPSRSGRTDEQGRFSYLPGEQISFSIGSLVLGATPARSRITPADLHAGDRAAAAPLRDPRVTNLARFVQSLGDDDDLRAGVLITDEIRAAVKGSGPIDFALPEAEFETHRPVLSCLQRVGRRLRSGPEARNHLRRSLAGIKKWSEVRVPTRDGSYLLADIYRPVQDGRYPAILRLSVYGRSFGTGSNCTLADRQRSEGREDRWFEDRPSELGPMLRYAENAVSANSTDWVPRGYVVVRLDGRGVGSTPGRLEPFSRQEAEDYYDAIEWSAVQPWCTGAVGLLGASYAATNQWNVAALEPSSLRAMIPWASDADAYRDLAYPGGIFNEGYRRGWWANVTSLQCDSPPEDFIAALVDHPFDDPAFYGTQSSGPRSVDFSRIRVPFLTAVSQTATLHSRAGFEAMLEAASPHRQLVVVAANYFSYLYRECLDLQFRFFDRFLRGADGEPGVDAPVRLMLRTGAGDYVWRDETGWPVPGTTCQPWYLDGCRQAPNMVADPLPRTFTLTPAPAGSRATVAYPAGFKAGQSRWATGVSFLSGPLEADLVLAGHFRASLWVSTTSHDMDVFVSLRVVDPDGSEIRYAVRDRHSLAPVTWGCLKVSHRRLDPERSTLRPWHTHRQGDYAPLGGEQEVVAIDVELMPATAAIPSGSRLRLDIQPVEGCGGYLDAAGSQAVRAYDATYHDGAENLIHTGGDYQSCIWLPVVGAEASWSMLGSRM